MQWNSIKNGYTNPNIISNDSDILKLYSSFSFSLIYMICVSSNGVFETHTRTETECYGDF